jgi:hypothetical protein
MDENINENIKGLNAFMGERPMGAMDKAFRELMVPRPYPQICSKRFYQKYEQDYRVDPSLTSGVLSEEAKVGFESLIPEGEQPFIFEKLIFITPVVTK